MTKVIKRVTLRNDTLSGSYLGGLSSKAYNCANPANNNQLFEDGGAVSVTHPAGVMEAEVGIEPA